MPLRKETCPSDQDIRVGVPSRASHRLRSTCGHCPGAETSRLRTPFGGCCPSLVDELHACSGTEKWGSSGRRGQARAAVVVVVGDSSDPVSRTAGLPDPASLSRSQAVMVQDQRLPRVPAEPGTIPRLCTRLLGAGETKRKCQKRVNQTRYSVTITSLSGLLGPCAPRTQAGHLRGAHSRYWGPVVWVCQQHRSLLLGHARRQILGEPPMPGESYGFRCTGSEFYSF